MFQFFYNICSKYILRSDKHAPPPSYAETHVVLHAKCVPLSDFSKKRKVLKI
jgi:hypothetical protein